MRKIIVYHDWDKLMASLSDELAGLKKKGVSFVSHLDIPGCLFNVSNLDQLKSYLMIVEPYKLGIAFCDVIKRKKFICLVPMNKYAEVLYEIEQHEEWHEVNCFRQDA